MNCLLWSYQILAQYLLVIYELANWLSQSLMDDSSLLGIANWDFFSIEYRVLLLSGNGSLLYDFSWNCTAAAIWCPETTSKFFWGVSKKRGCYEIVICCGHTQKNCCRHDSWSVWQQIIDVLTHDRWGVIFFEVIWFGGKIPCSARQCTLPECTTTLPSVRKKSFDIF